MLAEHPPCQLCLQTRSKEDYAIVLAREQHLDRLADLFKSYLTFYKQTFEEERARKYLEARMRNGESVVFLALSEKDSDALVCVLSTIT